MEYTIRFYILCLFFISISSVCSHPCHQTCGISNPRFVPHPFVIDQSCDGYSLTCNDTSGKLYLQDVHSKQYLVETIGPFWTVIRIDNITDFFLNYTSYSLFPSYRSYRYTYSLSPYAYNTDDAVYNICSSSDNTYIGKDYLMFQTYKESQCLIFIKSSAHTLTKGCYSYSLNLLSKACFEYNGGAQNFSKFQGHARVNLTVSSYDGTRYILILRWQPILIIIGIAIVAWLSPLCCCILIRRLVRAERTKGMKMIQKLFQQHATLFSYRELQRATNNFSHENKLGGGGFGTVYKGILPGGTLVAIKKANTNADHGYDSFLNEVNILSQVNHRNLVKLLGFCISRLSQILLVYEYVPNGTLREHLQNGTLNWSQRLKIATETALALSYLHTAATPPILHKDVKSANILLDEDLTAKVADFGLSKLVSTESMDVSTTVQGTLGYLDPDYIHTHRFTEKSDVYSYGVVLLELMSGQKPWDLARETNINLASFAVPLIEQDVLDTLFDPNVAAEDFEGLRNVAKLAAKCLSTPATTRPTMTQVLEELLKPGAYAEEDSQGMPPLLESTPDQLSSYGLEMFNSSV